MDDGGRPITHFVIQKKDQFGGKSPIIASRTEFNEFEPHRFKTKD